MSHKSITASRKYLLLWTCSLFDLSSSESRQFSRRFYLALAAFGVLSWAAVALVKENFATGIWRIPVALLPVIPLVWLVEAFVRYLGRLDELQRQIQLEAIGFSFAGSALFCVAWTFLETLAGFPSLLMIWVVPLMMVLHGLGLARAARRYWE